MCKYKASIKKTSNTGYCLFVVDVDRENDPLALPELSVTMEIKLAAYLKRLVDADRCGSLVSDQIGAGDFENKIPHPGRPKAGTHGAQAEHFDVYREGMVKARFAFRTALEEAYNMATHPKRDNFWRMAWDRGHSNGLVAVTLEYEELIEIFL